MSKMKKSSSVPRIIPQPTPTIIKSDRTRAAILNSALDYIWSHPFRDMTVSSLMAPTGVGRSAFYQYFRDLHEVMETLLDMLAEEVFGVTGPWFEGAGDPVALLHESLGGLVDVCHNLGPILRAVEEASASDETLDKAWRQFVKRFDNAITTRIEADQAQGLISNFDARPVAIALNRLDLYTLIQAFGQPPKRKPKPVREALARIWISTLYGSEWLGDGRSDLVRK